MKRNPRVDVHMLVENTQILLRMINDGELDFAVVEGYFLQERVRLPHLVPGALCLRVRGGPPLAQAAPRPLSALFGENLILRNQGSGSRDVLERVLEERNHHVGDFRHIVEISDLFVIKELVKADCGITFLYRKAVEKELAEGSLCQVALTDFQISMSSPSSGGRTAPLRRSCGRPPGPCGHCKKRSRKAAALFTVTPCRLQKFWARLIQQNGEIC